MKKLFGFMLLCATMFLSLSSCSDDDEVFVTTEQIIGTWDVIWAEQDGESLDVPEGYIILSLTKMGAIELQCLMIITLELINLKEIPLLVQQKTLLRNIINSRV